MTSLQNKTALATGASRGIGRATATAVIDIKEYLAFYPMRVGAIEVIS
jgi:NAD(P)-dependent dehydrogenase (short-subunit alcohol dehydrogenase family)